MEMHITKREKLSYIHLKKETPIEVDDNYDKQQTENQKVKIWLFMVMPPEIMKCYLSLPNAHDI